MTELELALILLDPEEKAFIQSPLSVIDTAVSLIKAYGDEMFERGEIRGHYNYDWDKVELNL
jgi:hypothetical protein